MPGALGNAVKKHLVLIEHTQDKCQSSISILFLNFVTIRLSLAERENEGLSRIKAAVGLSKDPAFGLRFVKNLLLVSFLFLHKKSYFIVVVFITVGFKS